MGNPNLISDAFVSNVGCCPIVLEIPWVFTQLRREADLASVRYPCKDSRPFRLAPGHADSMEFPNLSSET